MNNCDNKSSVCSDKRRKGKIRFLVLIPAISFFVVMAVVNLWNSDVCLSVLTEITGFILNNFGWAFNLCTAFCTVLVIAIYFSPLGKIRIGGSKAKPIMNYWNWVWITLCSIIASGILFWSCSEPMMHMYNPPLSAGVEAGSAGAAAFSMEVMYLEWTWFPFALYTVPTIAFAFALHNMKKSYSLGSALTPALGRRAEKYGGVIDVICLFSLIAGMATCLGIGALNIAGGLQFSGIGENNSTMWGWIILVTCITFTISSISGILKGIRILSSLNAWMYIFLIVFVFILGPTVFMMRFSTETFGSFLANIPNILFQNGIVYNESWAGSWPIYYWCNWLSWTLITSIFLGNLCKGYTVKQTITCNFIIPSIFSMIWIGLFSSAAVYFEHQGLGVYQVVEQQGYEAAVYLILDQLPLTKLIVPLYIGIVFISFVTASDSNLTSMTNLCTIAPEGGQGVEKRVPIWMKILLSTLIGLITWILLRMAGIEGLKAASNLGGFPNMFIVVLIGIGLIRIAKNPSKYDSFKEDYDKDEKYIEQKEHGE